MAANLATNVGTAAAPVGVCGDPTVRRSVARTRFGYGQPVAASTVKSETKGLRVAYPATECNIPAI
jgi:hypothetical protein